MADIFISYAREDEACAAEVARALDELGWSVFWDRRIVAGSSWDEVVERELGSSKCVVVLWSAASVTSRWVKTEANFGLRRHTLVPALLDHSEPPLAFRFLEAAQLQTWTGTLGHPEFRVLTDGIAQHLKLPQPSTEPVQDDAMRSDRSASRTAITVRRRSWPAWGIPWRRSWVVGSTMAGFLVIAGIVLLRERVPQPMEVAGPTAHAGKPLASAPGTPAADPTVADPIAKSAAPTATPPTTAPGSTSEAAGRLSGLSSTSSPTPLPVPFGAPVKFRSDFWELPDEPLLGLVEIPEGPFMMGSDKKQDPSAEDVELQPHKVVLKRYYLGRYEVTVGQFRMFVQASGYQRSKFAVNGAADQPVRVVSWEDAFAYSSWLDERMRQSLDLPGGVRAILSRNGQPCQVTLPSEAEWEKGARGTDARIFPWGGRVEASRGNFGGTAAVTPVGSYPAGASPYGLLDMSGNVSEWTRSLSGSRSGTPGFGYPYLPDDPKLEDLKAPNSARVVRGGSYNSAVHNTRAAFRTGHNPRYADAATGFRIAVSCLRS